MKMSQLKHTLAVLTSIGFAYFWLSHPNLATYSPLAFAIAIFGFFISKRITNARLWHILPETNSFEIVFVSFSITILIGSTGNASSVFYPFVYIHLFFLVMTTRQLTAIIATLAIMTTHYLLEPEIDSLTIAEFTTLPLMLIFFLFSRRQYDNARLQHKIIDEEKKQLETMSKRKHNLESFLSEFLQPKLDIITDLIETSAQRNEPLNIQTLSSQIDLIDSESQKIINQKKSTLKK